MIVWIWIGTLSPLSVDKIEWKTYKSQIPRMFDTYHIYPGQEKEKPSEKIEYEKLWAEQSKLFWGRLQTATALHSAILIGWYKINEPDLKDAVLILGIVISILLSLIMLRDSTHIDFLKKKVGCASGFPWGRLYGFLIVIILMVTEVLLFYRG